MNKKIIVTTDFTASSQNALSYMCEFISGDEFTLYLLHIYTMPTTYSTEGVVVASLKDVLDSAQEKLDNEIKRVKNTYPAVQIEGSVIITGGFTEALSDIIDKERPEMVVMGAINDYSELWMWDNELLSALTGLTVPVLIIPRQIAYTPIHNIGFACDYRNLSLPHQVNFIKWLTGHTKAQLHVVHVTRAKPANETVRQQNEALLQDALLETAPKYYAIEDPNVIDALTRFVKEHELDFLIVIPHRHDIWYSIFHQSHTRQLARLNNLPILALHD